ncbi:MAG: hypothetical protein BIFFINMI_04111 [Phycisphaerae bacterium]|nr:hypothetical protein [Phycisphaerae bacterium]
MGQDATVRSETKAPGGWMADAVPPALGYARALLAGARGGPDPEDVVHDALVRLLTRARLPASGYDLAADGRKLLFRAVGNGCINARTRRRELASLNGELPGTNVALADTIAGDAADEPERRAMSAELAARVAGAMARLPALQRAVMALRGLGQTAVEVADALDLTPAHVAVLTHRARARLAEMLADDLSEGQGE